MAASLFAATASESFRFLHVTHLPLKPTLTPLFIPSIRFRNKIFNKISKRRSLAICFVVDDKKQSDTQIDTQNEREENLEGSVAQILTPRVAERLARKKSERFTYLVAAVMSSLGITSMAVMTVYYRFAWQMEGGEVPLSEMFGTFALSVGAAVGMEFWAQWAHRALWHASLWHMHESHHKPREGPFELNDVFAIINAVPAIALLSYGFFNEGLFPGLCFGAGLGITVFGMAYMFVHDGLVHKRFPVGPIANVPYLRRVAAAHQELAEVGGLGELEKEIKRRTKSYKS